MEKYINNFLYDQKPTNVSAVRWKGMRKALENYVQQHHQLSGNRDNRERESRS